MWLWTFAHKCAGIIEVILITILEHTWQLVSSHTHTHARHFPAVSSLLATISSIRCVIALAHNYYDLARVLRAENGRVYRAITGAVRASTPLVSQGTRWDPRVFECSRSRVNARVPPGFRPLPQASLAPRYFRLFRARYGAQIKAEKVIWPTERPAGRASLRGSRSFVSRLTIVPSFFYTFNRSYTSLYLKGFSLNRYPCALFNVCFNDSTTVDVVHVRVVWSLHLYQLINL